MLAECLVAFRDLDCGVLREAGDRFEVSADRFRTLNSSRYGELVREVVEPEAEKPAPTRAKRTAAKRKAKSSD